MKIFIKNLVSGQEKVHKETSSLSGISPVLFSPYAGVNTVLARVYAPNEQNFENVYLDSAALFISNMNEDCIENDTMLAGLGLNLSGVINQYGSKDGWDLYSNFTDAVTCTAYAARGKIVLPESGTVDLIKFHITLPWSRSKNDSTYYPCVDITYRGQMSGSSIIRDWAITFGETTETNPTYHSWTNKVRLGHIVFSGGLSDETSFNIRLAYNKGIVFKFEQGVDAVLYNNSPYDYNGVPQCTDVDYEFRNCFTLTEDLGEITHLVSELTETINGIEEDIEDIDDQIEDIPNQIEEAVATATSEIISSQASLFVAR